MSGNNFLVICCPKTGHCTVNTTVVQKTTILATKFQEFDPSIAIYLLSTALFEPPEQMQLIITFQKS